MRKVVAAVLVCSGMTLGAFIGPVAPASADTPRCATFQEFRQVERGMRKARVHRILGTAGRFADGFAGGYTRYYPSCESVRIGGGDGGAYVSYDGWTTRVVEKRWIRYR